MLNSGMRAKLTDEDRQEIVAAYKMGQSGMALARRFGVAGPAIYRVLQIHQVPRRNSRQVSRFEWTADRLARLRAMYYEGLSHEAMGLQLGVSRSLVGRRLNMLGLSEKRIRKGAEHSAWTGGRHKTSDGYWRVTVPADELELCPPNSTGYAAEHRLIMSRLLGRRLAVTETVHHINGDRSDNRVENLQLRFGNHGQGAAFQCRTCGSHDVKAVPLN